MPSSQVHLIPVEVIDPVQKRIPCINVAPTAHLIQKAKLWLKNSCICGRCGCGFMPYAGIECFVMLWSQDYDCSRITFVPWNCTCMDTIQILDLLVALIHHHFRSNDQLSSPVTDACSDATCKLITCKTCVRCAAELLFNCMKQSNSRFDGPSGLDHFLFIFFKDAPMTLLDN